MKNHKILLAIGSSIIGGAQNVFLSILAELTKGNHEVVVLLPKGALVNYIEALDVKMYVVNYSSPIGLLQVYQVIKREKPDIINTHLTKCNVIISILNRLLSVPICCTLHNEIIHSRLGSIQKIIYPLFYNVLSRLNDGIIVVSEYAKQDLIQVGRVQENKICVVYNGIDIQKFIDTPIIQKQSEKFIFASVGRISVEKGHRYLVDAVNVLKEWDFECWIIGEGPLRVELERKSIEYGLEEKIKFLGYRSDVNSLIQQINVLILPSINENMGISILETFAFRKAVIATNVGGIPELVIHNSTGLLVPPKDSDALAAAMLHIYKHRDEAIKYGNNGYRNANKYFTSSAMGVNTLTYFNSLIRKKRRNVKMLK